MRNHLLPFPQPKMETRVRVIGVLYSIYIIICIKDSSVTRLCDYRANPLEASVYARCQRFARNLHVSRNKQLICYI